MVKWLRGNAAARADSETPPDGVCDDFNEYYSKNVQERSKQQRRKLTAGGALTGGALGMAAMGSTLAGPAGVAVAGAFFGYSLATRRGKQEQHPDAHPTLRRLRYLSLWGHWQLLEHEDAEGQSHRCRVLDEVVREFSPWVQQILVRRAPALARGHTDDREVLLHLAPLFCLLQRRAGSDTATESAEAMRQALDSGGSFGRAERDRARTVFPTIMETISALGRQSSASQEELFKSAGLTRTKQNQDTQKLSRRRLQRIVDAIGSLQGHGSLEAELATPISSASRHFSIALADDVVQDGESPTSGESSPRRDIPLEIPPEGVEDEGDFRDFGEEDEQYFSASDASDEEGPTQNRSSHTSAGKHSVRSDCRASFIERHAAFPLGTGPHSWQASDPSSFDVRSPSYFADRRKEPSARCMLDLVSCDVSLVGEDGPVMRAATHPKFCVQHLRRQGDRRFFFVQNWMLPPLQAVIVGALDPDASWYKDQDSPQARVWRRFLESTPEERHVLLKIIPSIEQGPWIVKRAAVKKPVLIGRKVKMQSYHEEGDHLEVVMDIASSKVEQRAVGLVYGAARAVQITIACLIEAREENELPETLLICPSFKSVNPDLLRPVAAA